MRTHYTVDITPDLAGQSVRVAGWLHEVRDLGGIVFLLLRDREGITQITMVTKRTNPDIVELVRGASKESALLVEGTVKEEPKAPGGYEIIPEKVSILGRADSPLPLDPTGKVKAELDTRLDARFLDVRNPSILSLFVVRHHVLGAAREFLTERGFIEITTPKIVATATEGGTALFPLSYFDREAFLNQSPQLFKQVMIGGGFDNVFEVGPIFRAEEHDTTRHLNEATSIDVE